MLFVLAVPLGIIAQTSLQSGDRKTGRLTSSNQEAWYTITVTQDGEASLTVTPLQNANLRQLYLYAVVNGENKELTWIWVDGGDGGTLTRSNLAPGTYKVRLTGYPKSNEADATYQISYTFTAPSQPTEPEPNNTWQTAVQLEDGKTQYAHIGYDYYDSKDTEDWYKIVVPKDGQLDLVFNCNQTYELKLAYIDFDWSNGETYNRKSTGWYPDPSGTLTIPDAGPGTYYIKVARSSGHGGYTLRYNFTASSYGNDPADNDEWNKGSEIASGQTVQGHLGYRDASNYIDDVDWYTIQVPQDGQVDLVFDCELKYDLKLAYVDFCWSNGETYYNRQGTGWYPNQSDTLTIDNVGVGTYYIHVTRSEGHGGYKLKYIFTPNNYRNDTEPNDELEQATQTLGNNETLTAHLGYRDANNKVDDYDWFRLDIDNRAAMLALNVESDTLSTLKLAYVDIIQIGRASCRERV